MAGEWRPTFPPVGPPPVCLCLQGMSSPLGGGDEGVTNVNAVHTGPP